MGAQDDQDVPGGDDRTALLLWSLHHLNLRDEFLRKLQLRYTPLVPGFAIPLRDPEFERELLLLRVALPALQTSLRSHPENQNERSTCPDVDYDESSPDRAPKRREANGATEDWTLIGSFSKHDGNLNGDVLRNKRIVRTKQRERIISSPSWLIKNVLVL